ncbi:MAG: signal peptidase I [Edaphobacter sp.]|uniref:signal peptidase I n=1 Tax=Edaphobacter sp. TaxID=1934404 RepID=UPI0023961D6A|nr:signal peptidase I [Edaphobacter sp.]MDE1178076.1 signal peptidase I [Edaphobacter sp.]
METTQTEEQATSAAQQDERTETPLESLSSIASVLAVGLFVMTFIFQNFEIPSGSMEKTLLIGDHVLVDRVTLAPPTKWAPFTHYRDVNRGDIIVFLKPGEPDMFLVKRAIGLPGDRIHLRNGVVYRNGVAQNEPYAAMPSSDGDPQHEYQPYRDDFPSIPPDPMYQVTASWQYELPTHIEGGDLVVPPGKVFAMGDNRPDSLDGRFWGFVPRENIVGRPLFVYWSFETPADQANKQTIADRFSFMTHILIHFFTETRWSRTFHLIR